MTIYINGTDTTDLSVPDLVVNVLAPPSVDTNGVSNDRIGLVGTAAWGPVNSPTPVGSLSAFVQTFGPIQARTFDLGTHAAIAIERGAAHFRCVRVTDGTDVAATATIQTNCLTVTSKYTGSAANGDKVTIAAGTKPNSFKVTVTRSGQTPESFDNIVGSGNALWGAIATAINAGQSSARGASALVVATAGAGTTAPTLASYTLAGGTDGVTTITTAKMIGVDTSGARTGMYALRGTGIALMDLCDLTDSATLGTQLAFAVSEQCQAVFVSPAGDTLANFATIQTQDSPWMKAIFGDWAYWYDSINDITRLVSPQAFYVGEKVAVGVQNSVLNRQLSTVVGTQSSAANTVYSADDLEQIAAARGDVLCRPCPGGDYFGFRFGRNTSSRSVTHQDNYTTLVDYIARTLNTTLGGYVGRLITDTERAEAKATVDYFLENLWTSGFIGDSGDGTKQPYSTTVSAGTAGSGTQKAVVMVKFFDVNEYFIVDLTAGASVTISSTTTSA